MLKCFISLTVLFFNFVMGYWQLKGTSSLKTPFGTFLFLPNLIGPPAVLEVLMNTALFFPDLDKFCALSGRARSSAQNLVKKKKNHQMYKFIVQ